jgi:phosphoribosylformylglycinamidine (FGAM) synthase-like enzyme
MGVVGVIPHLDVAPPGPALRDGDDVVLLGSTASELGGSEWAAVSHGLRGGRPPEADVELAARLHEFVAWLVRERAVSALHDCADGGLAVALTRMAIAGDTGFIVEFPSADGADHALTPAEAMFSESANRVVLGVEPSRRDDVLARAKAAGVPTAFVGSAGGDELRFAGACDVALGGAAAAWRNGLPRLLATDA